MMSARPAPSEKEGSWRSVAMTERVRLWEEGMRLVARAGRCACNASNVVGVSQVCYVRTVRSRDLGRVCMHGSHAQPPLVVLSAAASSSIIDLLAEAATRFCVFFTAPRARSDGGVAAKSGEPRHAIVLNGSGPRVERKVKV